MSIVQDFERAPNGSRLKVRDNVEVSFKIMPGVPEAFARRETTYRDHNFERPEGGVFNFKGDQATGSGAAFMPDEFWQEYRPAELRTTTATMQGLMKRLRGSKLFYWAEQVVVVMVNGYIPTAKVSKFDLSIPVGVSYEYKNIVLDARYNWGLVKVVNVGDAFYNRCFMLSLGYKFALGD